MPSREGTQPGAAGLQKLRAAGLQKPDYRSWAAKPKLRGIRRRGVLLPSSPRRGWGRFFSDEPSPFPALAIGMKGGASSPLKNAGSGTTV